MASHKAKVSRIGMILRKVMRDTFLLYLVEDLNACAVEMSTDSLSRLQVSN